MHGTDAPLPDEAVLAHIDATKSNIARVYDATLRGTDHYKIDRVIVHRLQQIAAEIYQLMWDQRNFLIRVIQFLAWETGITQFLDCGAGLPTAENTHQVVQRIQPDARVVYIDNDLTVLTHGRALLATNHHAHISVADILSIIQNAIDL
jgi:S-adenosyl methyltransferase